MGLADIQEKQSEERKREKRLVHFANTVSRDFLNSKYVKSKTKTAQEATSYITKSFLDYLFFEEHREIRELYEEQVNHFLMDFAPRKLTLSADQAKEATSILADFLSFLEDEGYIHIGHILSSIVKKQTAAFSKQFPKTVKGVSRPQKPKAAKKMTKKKTAQAKYAGMDIGRNDPCPCGSGKKFKKCCGKQA